MFTILNVRSDTEDLTAVARIRDAALARFPADGFEATTVRALAEDARVSPALIVHHFGSKEGLRRACDAHVVEQIRTIKGDAIAERTMADSGFLSGAFRVAPPLMRYLGWALTSGSTEAAELFDEMVEESTRLLAMAEEQGYVRPTDDPRARAAVMLSMQLGGLILADHLKRVVGVNPFTAEGVIRLSRMMLEIFTGGVFEPETAVEMRRALTEAASTVRKEADDG